MRAHLPRRLRALFLGCVFATALLGSCASARGERITSGVGAPGAPRILVVTAHPDDETTCAGALYKAATFLGAACDLVVITNGEGGFKYATLAERTYGLPLTDEQVGRAHLPRIRAREMRAAAGILGIRDLYLLGEEDHRYTQDVGEVLGAPGKAAPGVWDVSGVRATLTRLMARERYDFVFVLAPTRTTHGHHQAASILAVEAARGLEAEARPVCLAVHVAERADAPAPVVVERPAAALADDPPLIFDRAQKFGHRDRLDYRLVVNHVIATHHSQGTMQLAMNGGPFERYYLFAENPEGARERASTLFEALRDPQFPAKTYGSSAGTNAAGR